jgi:hypothetical protein
LACGGRGFVADNGRAAMKMTAVKKQTFTDRHTDPLLPHHC